MNKVLIFLISIFLFTSLYSQTAIDLRYLNDKKTEKKEEKKDKKTSIEQSTETKKTAPSKSVNKSKHKKKPVKKTNSKKEKYVFKKKNKELYKFDEKGNPIIPKQNIKKSTETKKNLSSDLMLGIEGKDVNVKKENK